MKKVREMAYEKKLERLMLSNIPAKRTRRITGTFPAKPLRCKWHLLPKARAELSKKFIFSKQINSEILSQQVHREPRVRRVPPDWQRLQRPW